MNLSEDKRGIALFLVPALMGWAQIIIILLAHLFIGDAGTLVGLATMGIFLIVMAVLVSRDGRELGIDTGGYIVFVFIMFLFGYPAYMGARKRRGASLGLGAGILAMGLFFTPLLVLPLGAKILSNRMSARPTPTSDTHGALPVPVVPLQPNPHTNRCDQTYCEIYTFDDAAKAMLLLPDNAKKTSLHLHSPTADSIAWLSALPAVTTLVLSDGEHFDDLTPLSKLTQLEDLEIWNSKTKTIAPLADLTRLEVLKLYNCSAVVDINALKSLPNLKELLLDAFHVTDLTPLGEATHLRKLRLQNSHVALDALAKLTTLQELEVQPQNVSIAPLAALTELRLLNLWGAKITDPTPLSKLVNLETLEMQNNHLTAIPFVTPLKHLKTLDLDDQKDFKDLAPVRGMPELRDLEASATSVEDLTPLATCPKLQTLKLDKTKVSNLAPLSLSKALRTITLSQSEVHDLMPLAKIPTLTTVTVHEGQIPDAALTAFKAAAPTVHVTVNKN